MPRTLVYALILCFVFLGLSNDAAAQEISKVQVLDFFDGRPVSGVKISSDYGLEAQVSDENGVVEFRFRPDAPLLAPSLNFEKEGWILPSPEDLFRTIKEMDTLRIYICERKDYERGITTYQKMFDRYRAGLPQSNEFRAWKLFVAMGSISRLKFSTDLQDIARAFEQAFELEEIRQKIRELSEKTQIEKRFETGQDLVEKATIALLSDLILEKDKLRRAIEGTSNFFVFPESLHFINLFDFKKGQIKTELPKEEKDLDFESLMKEFYSVSNGVISLETEKKMEIAQNRLEAFPGLNRMFFLKMKLDISQFAHSANVYFHEESTFPFLEYRDALADEYFNYFPEAAIRIKRKIKRDRFSALCKYGRYKEVCDELGQIRVEMGKEPDNESIVRFMGLLVPISYSLNRENDSCFTSLMEEGVRLVEQADTSAHLNSIFMDRQLAWYYASQPQKFKEAFYHISARFKQLEKLEDGIPLEDENFYNREAWNLKRLINSGLNLNEFDPVGELYRLLLYLEQKRYDLVPNGKQLTALLESTSDYIHFMESGNFSNEGRTLVDEVMQLLKNRPGNIKIPQYKEKEFLTVSQAFYSHFRSSGLKALLTQRDSASNWTDQLHTQIQVVNERKKLIEQNNKDDFYAKSYAIDLIELSSLYFQSENFTAAEAVAEEAIEFIQRKSMARNDWLVVSNKLLAQVEILKAWILLFQGEKSQCEAIIRRYLTLDSTGEYRNYIITRAQLFMKNEKYQNDIREILYLFK
ncbi:hypothetical protein LAG90_04550 [Marinilongibacter aquaticus]|uniref:hypothetical protein n=1 Tax=Marinilongibacter aquaticus TaxID=2975157 RepID=UPI0021BD1EFE|nr:hypothetical protein [Marinilongibacter aquaticus]UBM59917.1 hypothetical protein LAG90_04550 [Marinilongibacter aquaticus]